MSAKHTPGPWNIGHRYGNHRMEIVNATGGKAIASVWTHDRNDNSKRPNDRDDYSPIEEGMANLALIAAAPKLLAALESVQSLAYSADNADDLETAKACARKIFGIVSAAIAKAKGGEA